MITYLSDKFSSDDIVSYLEAMVNELSWKVICAILESRTLFMDNYLAGGFQLKSRNIERAKRVLSKYANKDDYEWLFECWMKDKEQYGDIFEYLRTFSEPDTVQTGRESTSNMPEELFSTLANNVGGRQGIYFLLFSPFRFSEDEELLLFNSFNTDDNHEHSSKDDLTKILEDSALADEIGILRKEIKELKRESRSFERKCTDLQKDVMRLQAIVEVRNQTIRDKDEIIAKLDNAESETTRKLEAEIKKHENYNEQLRISLKTLNSKIIELNTDLDETRKQRDQLQQKYQGKIIDVLDRTNSSDIIKALNEPDEVKDLLSSLLKVKTTDEPDLHSLTLDEMISCWSSMSDTETATIKTIFNLTLDEMSSNKFSDTWPDMADQLSELKYSLRARAALADYITEILRCFFNPDNYTLQASPISEAGSLLSKSIQSLNLDDRTLSLLTKMKISTIGDLTRMSEMQLLRTRNFGRKNINRISASLARIGMTLSSNTPRV